MTERLAGRRVLIVEDDFHIAMLLEDQLSSAGCVITGPVPRLADALAAARDDACDAAVLDVNLAGERVYPVAEILSRRKIPFVFLTGYDAGMLPGEYAGRPRLNKPFKRNDLIAAVAELVHDVADC